MILITAVILVPACGGDEPLLTFEQSETSVTYGQHGATAGYAHVHVFTPQITATTPAAEAVNDAITAHAESLLASYTADAAPGTSLSEIADTFIAGYRSFKESFPASAQEWTIDITGRISFQSREVLSVVFETTAYTGGAHPISTLTALARTPENGRPLGIGQVSPDTLTLIRQVETRFREQQGLSADESLAEAGFWFPDDAFTLSPHWYLTDDSLHVHYNPYQIAPYAAGSFGIAIPR